MDTELVMDGDKDVELSKSQALKSRPCSISSEQVTRKRMSRC